MVPGMSGKETLRGCPTFLAGVGLMEAQQVGSGMDPAILAAQITVSFLKAVFAMPF